MVGMYMEKFTSGTYLWEERWTVLVWLGMRQSSKFLSTFTCDEEGRNAGDLVMNIKTCWCMERDDGWKDKYGIMYHGTRCQQVKQSKIRIFPIHLKLRFSFSTFIIKVKNKISSCKVKIKTITVSGWSRSRKVNAVSPSNESAQCCYSFLIKNSLQWDHSL